LGYLPEFRRGPALFLESMARQYGPVANFRLGPQNCYLVTHPDWIRDLLVTHASSLVKSRSTERLKIVLGEGLLTSEGTRHQRQRRLLQPAFHRPRLSEYATIMAEEAHRAGERFRDGQPADLDREMMRLTLAIVARSLFSAGVDEDARLVGESVDDLLKLFPWLVLPFSEHLQRIPWLPVSRRIATARSRLDSVVLRIVRQRRAAPDAGNDLLGLLLNARDEDDGAGMDDTQVRDEVLTLFLAGHETTAVGITWAWYLLAHHPQAESRLHEEVDRVLQGRPPRLEDVERLAYAERVFAEAIRLYPPAWAMGRRAVEPVPVGPYSIPAGSILILSPYVTQRNPELWPDPEAFDPNRFLPEAREARHRFAYFPFGGGPRICIGERFAWMEAVMILATLAQRWRFEALSREPLHADPLITLRPRGGFRVIARRRSI
jgi:cytochrome P450